VSDELEGKDQSNKACIENKHGVQLGYSQSVILYLTGLSWPLYIGGQVSRNQSGLIHITISIYDMDSYFDYDYTWS
jgi:hypothetical protein